MNDDAKTRYPLPIRGDRPATPWTPSGRLVIEQVTEASTAKVTTRVIWESGPSVAPEVVAIVDLDPRTVRAQCW